MQPNNATLRHISPLRYPGGKGKVANFIKLLIIRNSLNGVKYIEPYAGGASVALSLLLEGYVETIHVNDLNRPVYEFWNAAIHHTDKFCAKISNIPLDVDEWQRQRAIYNDTESEGFDLGFAAFYLNRTNRSGIIAGGGVIGGLEQQGKWKIDARFNREGLRARIERLAGFGSKITVTMTDAIELINSLDSIKERRLLYLDPPYYVKGEGLYDNFYQHADHVMVAEAIHRTGGPWIVSYDAAPEILDLYKGCESLRYSLGYSAAKASLGTEVMFFSPDLVQPDVRSVAGISNQAVLDARSSLQHELW